MGTERLVRFGNFYYIEPDANLRGGETEKRVAEVVSSYPGVQRVSMTRKNGPDDTKMIDLVVDLVPDLLFVDQVYVQVKSSSKEVRAFRREKMVGVTPGEDRRIWLYVRRLLLINGGDVVSRTKRKTPVTDEQIFQEFGRQLHELNDFIKTDRYIVQGLISGN